MSGFKNRKAELLGNLQEECAEVIKAASKILRFGETDQRRDDLNMEIGDVVAILELLEHEGLVNTADIQAGYERKLTKMQDEKHMEHLK